MSWQTTSPHPSRRRAKLPSSVPSATSCSNNFPRLAPIPQPPYIPTVLALLKRRWILLTLALVFGVPSAVDLLCSFYVAGSSPMSLYGFYSGHIWLTQVYDEESYSVGWVIDSQKGPEFLG